MLPSFRSHEEYINFVSENLTDVAIPEAHKDVVDKLKLLDLTGLRLLFIPLYCLSFGRIGFAPEDLFRCFMAMVFCGNSTTTRGRHLKECSREKRMISCLLHSRPGVKKGCSFMPS